MRTTHDTLLCLLGLAPALALLFTYALLDFFGLGLGLSFRCRFADMRIARPRERLTRRSAIDGRRHRHSRPTCFTRAGRRSGLCFKSTIDTSVIEIPRFISIAADQLVVGDEEHIVACIVGIHER